MVYLFASCGSEEEKPKSDQIQPKVKVETPSVSKSKSKPIAKSDHSMGERLFLLCEACHSLKQGEAHKTGPNLHGIFDAKAGTREGFDYSDAVINSGLVWSEETIDKWLTEPDEMLPGTKMAFIGLSDPKKRAALIAYLKEATQ